MTQFGHRQRLQRRVTEPNKLDECSLTLHHLSEESLRDVDGGELELEFKEFDDELDGERMADKGWGFIGGGRSDNCACKSCKAL